MDTFLLFFHASEKGDPYWRGLFKRPATAPELFSVCSSKNLSFLPVSRFSCVIRTPSSSGFRSQVWDLGINTCFSKRGELSTGFQPLHDFMTPLIHLIPAIAPSFCKNCQPCPLPWILISVLCFIYENRFLVMAFHILPLFFCVLHVFSVLKLVSDSLKVGTLAYYKLND